MKLPILTEPGTKRRFRIVPQGKPVRAANGAFAEQKMKLVEVVPCQSCGGSGHVDKGAD